MKKIVQVTGGVLIAAAAVLVVINIYKGNIFPGLKDAAKTTDTAAAHPKDEYEQAVLADPVFTYTGAFAKKAGEEYDMFSEIQVTDSMDGYEKTLKEAIAEGKIKVMELQVLEYREKEMTDAAADIHIDTGGVSVKKSGIYQVKISGMDSHNNPVKTNFLIAVNRKGV